MSQLPAPVKKEFPENGLLSATAVNGNDYKADDGWQDIPLKCCTKEDMKGIRYHIMKLQSKHNVNINDDFTKPVRLHRKDPRNIQFHLSRKEIDERKKEESKSEAENENQLRRSIDAAKKAAIERGEDPNEVVDELEPDMSRVAPDGGARKSKRSLFKRKTRPVNLANDEKQKFRYEEYYPWVLEDYEGQNVFVGNYEAGASDTLYVLFVFDKDGFKMVPAEKIYKFTQRNKYATLTLEEAEAKMEKNAAVPRWLMKHMEENANQAGATPDQRFRNLGQSSGSTLPLSSNERNRRLRTVLGNVATNEMDSDHDDIDFDEEFADDEEAPIMDFDEEENKISERKMKKEMLKAAHFDGKEEADDDDGLDDLFETEKSRKVDKEGKKLRKVLHKTEGNVYESEDEENENPYVSQSDLENDEGNDEEIQVKKEKEESLLESGQVENNSGEVAAHNIGDGIIKVKASSLVLREFPVGEWNPHAKRALDHRKEDANIQRPTEVTRRSSSPVSDVSNVDLNDGGPDNLLVTTNEVINIVSNNPLTTKELLLRLRARVNSHPENKQRIISIVKQNLKLANGKLVLKE